MSLPSVRWHPQPDHQALAASAVARILAAAKRAYAARGAFHMVLAGGSTPVASYHLLAQAEPSCQGWQLYLGDERCLPVDHADRNSVMVGDALLDRLAERSARFHPIAAERGAQAAASDYGRLLTGVDCFDLVLLGLGEDGHTASLFPGHPPGVAPDVSASVLAVHDAPKPPPDRVSMSAWRLGRAREVLFLVAGEGKREAVRRWRAGDSLPASLIRPPGGVDVLLTDSLPGTGDRTRQQNAPLPPGDEME